MNYPSFLEGNATQILNWICGFDIYITERIHHAYVIGSPLRKNLGTSFFKSYSFVNHLPGFAEEEYLITKLLSQVQFDSIFQ